MIRQPHRGPTTKCSVCADQLEGSHCCRTLGWEGSEGGRPRLLFSLRSAPSGSPPLRPLPPPVSCALIIYSSGHRKKISTISLAVTRHHRSSEFPPRTRSIFFASPPSPRPRRTRSARGSFARAGLSCPLTSFFPRAAWQPKRFASSNQRERATLFRVLGRRKTALVIRLTIERRRIFFLMPVTRGVSTHGAPINLP